MPELAEVEFYRKQWLPAVGESVQAVLAHSEARIFRKCPASAFASLTHRRLEGASAHGKQMLFHFTGESHLLIHLGMTGRLALGDSACIPDKHDHLVLCMERSSLVFSDYRMFGSAQVFDALPDSWKKLPPLIQSRAFSRKRLDIILNRHPMLPLKSLLLRQEAFPGIGNWMADEILWRAALHPLRTPNSLRPRETEWLFRCTKQVVRDALRVIGTNWGDPPPCWLFPHRWRKGGFCPKSRAPLEYIQVNQRTTCFSPKIQIKSPPPE